MGGIGHWACADNVGVGEREARVASRLVAARHYGYVPPCAPFTRTPSVLALTVGRVNTR